MRLRLTGVPGDDPDVEPYATQLVRMAEGEVLVKFSPLDDDWRLRWDRELRQAHLMLDIQSLTAKAVPAGFERDLVEEETLAMVRRGPVRLEALTLDGQLLAAEAYEYVGLTFVFAADQVTTPLAMAAPLGYAGDWPGFVTSEVS